MTFVRALWSVMPSGAPEIVVRTVTEHARTLRFDDFGFEGV